MKKRKILLFIFILLLVAIFIVFLYINNENKKRENKIKEEEKCEKIKGDILSHYNTYVVTNDNSDLYVIENGEYIKSGSIGKNQIIELKEIDITHEDTYLPLKNFDGYYIYYESVNKADGLIENNQRYKNYIPYNKNIVTNNSTSFYNESDELVYSFDKSYDLPIIVNKTDKYGVEFNNQLLYVKKDDVKNIIEKENTTLENTKSIAVLNYHFFFDDTLESERKNCDQSICISTENYRKHLSYIKDNDIFTPTMEEFEMYLDSEIQLPKSVVITIDDGWRMERGIELLEEYKLNGTVFLITKYHADIPFLHSYKYVEFHSHGDDLHNQRDCPGGQGGAIKCKDTEFLLNDLAISSEKLGGSKYFCYPFYEFNDYSISVLKEAGFTMAFAGGGRRASIGVDKYRIPRFAIQRNTSVSEIANFIGN